MVGSYRNPLPVLGSAARDGIALETNAVFVAGHFQHGGPLVDQPRVDI